MNSMDYATRTDRLQYTFKAREAAAAFKTAAGKMRITGRPTLRKSLPEFRHHGSPGWSVFVTPWAMPDGWEIAKLAKSYGGRIWGSSELHPTPTT